MKKLLAILLALTMVLSLAACSGGGQEGPSDDGQPKTGRAAIDVIGEDGIDWNHMTMDELYEMA